MEIREAVGRCLGRDVSETLRSMLCGCNGAEGLPFEVIKLLSEDEVVPAMVRMCALQVVTAATDPRSWRFDEDGNRWLHKVEPAVGAAFDRIADRIQGKAAQTININQREDISPSALEARLVGLLSSNPEVVDLLREHLIRAGIKIPDPQEPVEVGRPLPALPGRVAADPTEVLREMEGCDF